MVFVRQILIKLEMSSIRGYPQPSFEIIWAVINANSTVAIQLHSSMHSMWCVLCGTEVLWLTAAVHAMKANILKVNGIEEYITWIQ